MAKPRPPHTPCQGLVASLAAAVGGSTSQPSPHLACIFALLASTMSSAVSTPTPPPQKEATMGSTSANWVGRCMLRMKSKYEVPAARGSAREVALNPAGGRAATLGPQTVRHGFSGDSRICSQMVRPVRPSALRGSLPEASRQQPV